MRGKIIIIVIVFILGFFFFVQTKEIGLLKEDLIEKEKAEEKEKTMFVAVCPTFYYMAEGMENNSKINIIKTGSTSESLGLFKGGTVDFIVSGRALKKGEPQLPSIKIGKGYDFIFKNEIVIYEKEMGDFLFYTNLSKEEIVQEFEYISEKNLIEVENIYEYLNEGIVITHLNDFSKGEIVHILKENNSRVRLSRLPRIYYRNDNLVKEAGLIEIEIKNQYF